MPYQILTFDQVPDFESQIDRLSQEAWPEFLLQGNIRYWGSLFREFAGFQILLCDPAYEVIAVGHTVPLVLDDTFENLPTGIDNILERAMDAYHHQHTPTTLSALAAIVAKSHQRRGLSSAILRAMKSLAAEHRLSDLIAPVRPTLKSLYPLTRFERYIQWKREDGSPFDPWLRVHWRLGAEQLQVIRQAMVVTGTVSEWEEWTGMCFPESGEYIVPGALQPVTIDRERNMGHYEDPNVWMRHSSVNRKQKS